MKWEWSRRLQLMVRGIETCCRSSFSTNLEIWTFKKTVLLSHVVETERYLQQCFQRVKSQDGRNVIIQRFVKASFSTFLFSSVIFWIWLGNKTAVANSKTHSDTQMNTDRHAHPVSRPTGARRCRQPTLQSLKRNWSDPARRLETRKHPAPVACPTSTSKQLLGPDTCLLERGFIHCCKLQKLVLSPKFYKPPSDSLSYRSNFLLNTA